MPQKRTRRRWSTRSSSSSIIKLETSASTPSLAIFLLLLLPLLFPIHCSTMWRKSDKKPIITIRSSSQMFVLHPSVIFVYLAKLCVLAVKSGGAHKMDTSRGWNCNATLTCFLIWGARFQFIFIFLFSCIFFSSAARHRLERFEEVEEANGQNPPNTRSIWGEMFILSFRYKKKKKNAVPKLQIPGGGGELNDLPNLISQCVYLPEWL